jgi:glycosyltransferase involved in cell wall biosynthesis
MPRELISLGFDAVDNSFFDQAARKAKGDAHHYRALANLPERYALASARFIGLKNLDGLLEAFARFRSLRQKSDLKLVLLGDGPERSALEKKRDDLRLNEVVMMPGFKQYEGIGVYYSLADVFVHLSRIEPWGLVVNEAMAAGLPVIVSNSCGCALNLVQPGVNGFLVEYDDIDGVANCLARLDDDLELRARMGERSSAIISEWGPERFAIGAIEAALAARKSGARRMSVGLRFAGAFAG